MQARQVFTIVSVFRIETPPGLLHSLALNWCASGTPQLSWEGSTIASSSFRITLTVIGNVKHRQFSTSHPLLQQQATRRRRQDNHGRFNPQSAPSTPSSGNVVSENGKDSRSRSKTPTISTTQECGRAQRCISMNKHI